MARAVQRTHVAVALTALIGLSLLVHWLAARRFGGLWIMPDETIYAHRALRLYHEGSLPILGGQGAGYGLLYPVVAGLPLSLGSFATGDAWLKPLQALVVSLAAIPVFMYSRRLMPDGYALVAAALTLASPLLLYSGLVMTEVVFYPVAALALLSVARAVATGTLRDQAIALGLIVLAILTRTQAVAFIGVFAVAVVVDALLARDRTRLRSFWPVWVVLALGLVAGLARPGLLGAYSTTVQSGYPLGAGLRMTYDHLAYVVVAVGVLPAAALAVLLVEAIRGRERDAHARALLAVTAAAVAILVVQVGFFAARFSQHLLGRDLAALPPLLFCVFALWLARGGPGRVVTAALTAFAVLAVAVLAPWNDLSAVVALPDTFDLALLEHLRPLSPTNVVTVGALVLLALFVLLPRRALFVLPVLVLALLTASSVVASNTISGLARDAQADLVGPTRDWIDRAATGDVTYVYDGEGLNIPYQEKFWNHRITKVVSLRPYKVSGPIGQTTASARTVGPAADLDPVRGCERHPSLRRHAGRAPRPERRPDGRADAVAPERSGQTLDAHVRDPAERRHDAAGRHRRLRLPRRRSPADAAAEGHATAAHRARRQDGARPEHRRPRLLERHRLRPAVASQRSLPVHDRAATPARLDEDRVRAALVGPDADEHLADVVAAEQPGESRRDVVDPVDDRLAVDELSVAHPGADLLEEGAVPVRVVGHDEALRRAAAW